MPEPAGDRRGQTGKGRRCEAGGRVKAPAVRLGFG